MVAFEAIIRMLARTVVLAGAITLILAAALKIGEPGAFHDALKAHGVVPAVPTSCGCGFSTGIVENRTSVAVRNDIFSVVLAGLRFLLRIEQRTKQGRPKQNSGRPCRSVSDRRQTQRRRHSASMPFLLTDSPRSTS
ncbi:MAG: hypothetical protein Kow0022_11740 [Phycisphaerales bacterium]